MTFDWVTIQPTNGSEGVNTLSVSVIKGRTTPQVIPSTNRNYLVASDIIFSGLHPQSPTGNVEYGYSPDLLNLGGKNIRLSCDIEVVGPKGTRAHAFIGFQLNIRYEYEGDPGIVTFACHLASTGTIPATKQRLSKTFYVQKLPYHIVGKPVGYIYVDADYATVARPKIEVVGDDNSIWQPAPEDLWTQQKSFIVTAPDGKAKAAFTVTYLGPNKQFGAAEFNPNQFY